jgi:hypothetical protein
VAICRWKHDHTPSTEWAADVTGGEGKWDRETLPRGEEAVEVYVFPDAGRLFVAVKLSIFVSLGSESLWDLIVPSRSSMHHIG